MRCVREQQELSDPSEKVSQELSMIPQLEGAPLAAACPTGPE